MPESTFQILKSCLFRIHTSITISIVVIIYGEYAIASIPIRVPDLCMLPFHCVKAACIWSYSGPYFPAFGLNTEIYGVSLCIQSKCGKIRTRITPNTDTFHAVFFRDLRYKITEQDEICFKS